MIRTIFSINFTSAEKKRIDRAAQLTGWRKSESAIFARALLLETVRNLIRKPTRRRAHPAASRQKRRAVNASSA